MLSRPLREPPSKGIRNDPSPDSKPYNYLCNQCPGIVCLKPDHQQRHNDYRLERRERRTIGANSRSCRRAGSYRRWPHLLATDANGLSVAAYTGATVQLLATAATGGSPVAVAVAPNGARIYVAAAGGGNVSVHDARTLLLVGSVTAGFSPTAIAVHPDNSRFHVANSSNREIAVFDAT